MTTSEEERLTEAVLDLLDEINPHPVLLVRSLMSIVNQTLASLKIIDGKMDIQ